MNFQLPTTKSFTNHLKLISAFDKYLLSVDDADTFLTNALIRFASFIRILKENDFPDDNDDGTDIIPPLDVCLIWYFFTINPFEFKEFMDYGFNPNVLVELLSDFDEKLDLVSKKSTLNSDTHPSSDSCTADTSSKANKSVNAESQTLSPPFSFTSTLTSSTSLTLLVTSTSNTLLSPLISPLLSAATSTTSSFNNSIFPLETISSAIDENFDFSPSSSQINDYLTFINRTSESYVALGDKSNSGDLNSDIKIHKVEASDSRNINLRNTQSRIAVIEADECTPCKLSSTYNLDSTFLDKTTIYCPLCEQALISDIPFLNEYKFGLLNDDFSVMVNSCECTFKSKITHDELAKRKLYRDLKTGQLSGLSKGILLSKLFSVDRIQAKSKIHKEVQLAIDESGESWETISLSKLLDLVNKRSMKFFVLKTLKKSSKIEQPIDGLTEAIINSYSKMKLLYSPLDHIQLDLNIIEQIKELGVFNKKMKQLNWTKSPFLENICQDSINRYSKWCLMTTEESNSKGKNKISTPTLDIDLIWRTCNLLGFQNVLVNKHNFEFLVQPYEPEQAELDIALTETSLRFKQRFLEEYELCFCNLCVAARHGKISKYETWAERNKEVIRVPPVYKDLPPDYGNSTLTDLPPGYGKEIDAEEPKETIEIGELSLQKKHGDAENQETYLNEHYHDEKIYNGNKAEEDDGQLIDEQGKNDGEHANDDNSDNDTQESELPPGYVNSGLASPPEYHNPEQDHKELPPDYTANAMFAMSETYPYYCTTSNNMSRSDDDAVIGACYCRGDRGCGGGKSVRSARIIVPNS